MTDSNLSTPEEQEMTGVRKVPFQKALTVLLTHDKGAGQADADLAAVSDDCKTVFRTDVPESYFSQLRLRVAQNPELLKKIAAFYLDEHDVLHPLGLLFEDELKWPTGFGDALWNIEVAIKQAREQGRARGV